MIHVTRAIVRRWLGKLLHIDDTPERTAAAFALGVLLSFSPFLGLHSVMGIALAFLLDLNRVAVLLGVYSNLPWIVGPYYTLATLVGASVTGARIPPDFAGRLHALFDLPLHGTTFWLGLADLLRPLLWPYAVGSSVGAVLLAAISYPLALAFVVSRRRIHDILHHHKPQ